MAAAEPRGRSRSRSPRGAESPAAAEAPGQRAAAPQVPAHWLAPAAAASNGKDGEAAAEAAPAPPRKGKGGKGKKGLGKGDAAADAQEAGDTATATSLLAMASRVESGDAEQRPDPAQLAQLLRRAAARVASLEKAVGNLGQTLQTVHALSGRVLDGCGGAQAQVPESAEPPEEAPKSYLIKKGDEDVQEQYRALQQARPSQTGGSVGGGALATSAKSKDEMDQARMARLERLEAQQAERKKQLEGADKKSKAHDAMFNTGLVNAPKVLGRL